MKKFLLVLISVLTLAVILITTIPAISVLSISNRKNPSERFYKNTKRMEGFEISYTHSVNKGRVHDFYKLHDDSKKTDDLNGDLLLTSTKFVSYGAGIPEPEETPGAVFKVTDNGYEISKLDRRVPKLTMAVGLIANHKVTFYEYENYIDLVSYDYSLTDFFEAQTSLIFENKKVPVTEFLLHRLEKK